MTESTERISVSKKVSNKEIESIDEWIIGSSEDTSLNKSIWAPKKERCENKGEIHAKVAAIKILGESSEHREKSLRWTLRGNSHIKKISERFDGNLWCIITFDCKKGFVEAKESLENAKEDYERLKLIPEALQEPSTKLKPQKKDKQVIKKNNTNIREEDKKKKTTSLKERS